MYGLRLNGRLYGLRLSILRLYRLRALILRPHRFGLDRRLYQLRLRLYRLRRRRLRLLNRLCILRLSRLRLLNRLCILRLSRLRLLNWLCILRLCRLIGRIRILLCGFIIYQHGLDLDLGSAYSANLIVDIDLISTMITFHLHFSYRT